MRIVVLLVLTVAGCAHRAIKNQCKEEHPGDPVAIRTCVAVALNTREIRGPDGKPMYEANCSGGGKTGGDCMNLAGARCGGAGYEVVSSDKETAGASGSVVAFPASNVAFVDSETEIKRILLFHCKTSLPANSH